MLNTSRSVSLRMKAGVTLIELMVAISIFGLLLALAAPSYSQWIANTRVRNTAEAIQNGLMLAKAEAVRRNTKVQFVLTSDDPIAANTNTITASAAGKAWMVRIFRAPAGTNTAADFIQGRSSAEGSTNTTVTAGQPAFVFTGVGGLSPIPAGLLEISVTASTGTSRTLKVTVAPGGAIRMCDAGLSITTTTMGC